MDGGGPVRHTGEKTLGQGRLVDTHRWLEEDALKHMGQALSDDEDHSLLATSSFNTGRNTGSSSSRRGNDNQAGCIITVMEPPGRLQGQEPILSSWKAFLVHMGPGFLMCIAYIDPGNLEADLQTGEGTGYSLLWVLLWSTILGGMLQSLAAKLGVATSKHLAQHCRDIYPGPMRVVLWIMAELAIIGSDIQEVIGSSLALMLLTGGALPLWVGVIVGAVSAYMLLFLERFGLKWLESFFQVLVATLGVCMGVLFFVARVPYGKVFTGLMIPKLSTSTLPTATGLLGAIIMPHNLFLHSALVHERGIPLEHRSTAKHSLWYYKLESFFALFVTLCINIAVISVFAHGFHGLDEKIGLYNAGTFLGNKYGVEMALVWAIGLLAAGQSSIMTGTYAGQFVMSGFLNLKMGPYKRALITRAVALVPTMLVALLYDTASSSYSGLDSLNQWLNILQSIQLPYATIPLLVLTANPSVVGLGFVNSRFTNIMSIGAATMIIMINAGTAYQTACAVLTNAPISLRILVWGIALLYLLSVAWLIFLSLNSLHAQQRSPNDSSFTDPLIPPTREDEEEGDGAMEDDIVKAAGTFVPPEMVPPLPLSNLFSPREALSSRARSVASSSMIVESSRYGTQSHAIDGVSEQASP